MKSFKLSTALVFPSLFTLFAFSMACTQAQDLGQSDADAAVPDASSDDGSSSKDAVSKEDTAAPGGTAALLAPAACGLAKLALSAPIVTCAQTTADLPTADGTAIADGTYVLSKCTYNGTEPDRAEARAFRVKGAVMQFSETDPNDPGGSGIWGATGYWYASKDGFLIHYGDTCVAPTGPQTPVTGTHFATMGSTVLLISKTGGIVYTFTKQ